MGALTAAIVGGVASIGGAISGANQAGKAARRAGREKDRLQAQLTELENSRQQIINPYENVTDLSGMITDTSGNLSNPFANLGVATAAAEMQAEEADISLANTLDTLAATGASAGGATALAQAALASKKGVASSIEQQEANNAKLKAQGEQNLQSMKQQEAIRVQEGRIGQAQRMQDVDIAGKEFMYNEREARETAKLNRVAGQIAGAEQEEANARANKAQAISSGIGGIGNIATSVIGAEKGVFG